MSVELAGITLEHLTQVSVQERVRIVHHAVPSMNGDLAQTLGRPSVVVNLRGIFYGPSTAEDLKALRKIFLERQPIDFFAEAIGEGYFAQVLISKLDTIQSAGYLDQFDFHCEVVEYIEPPQPIIQNPLTVLNSDLISEAGGYMDDVQNAIGQVSGIIGLLGGNFSFANPTERLPKMKEEFVKATDGVGVKP